jgi:hypothetical protein
VIKYKENERDGDPLTKSEFVFKTANLVTGENFKFKSRKIFKYKKANEETGDAFFQGYDGKIAKWTGFSKWQGLSLQCLGHS